MKNLRRVYRIISIALFHEKSFIWSIKKSKESTSTTIIDPGLIYSRAIVLFQTDHPNAMKIEDILAYELAVFPPAIFIEDGLMRPATNKSS